MVSYIIRRLLLMPITLFGITVMVFLIARLAPGKPGQLQQREQALDAETQQALTEWYERRYGLDKPLHIQYLNWWKGLFTIEVQASAWFDNQSDDSDLVQEVFTLRSPPTEYYARDSSGQWYVITDLQFTPGSSAADDEAFVEAVRQSDLEHQPEVKEEYLTPTHLFADATIAPIESLQADIEEERLVRAEETGRVEMTMLAPAWSQNGDPLFENPNNPEEPLVREGGEWLRIIPSMRASVKPITDDAALEPVLGGLYDELPQHEEGYAIPRHAIFYGTREPAEDPGSIGTPKRLYIETEVTVPSGIWINVPNEEKKVMLWEQEEPEPFLFVRDSDNFWSRLIGPTRVQPPPAEIYLQTDQTFLSQLPEAERDALPDLRDQPRTPRHVVVEGQLVKATFQPTERRIRRYQRETTIFEITLGESIQSRRTVVNELKRRLPVTLLISMIAFPLIYLLAIPAGMVMAVKRGRLFDTSGNVILLGLWSIPTVLSATLLIGYLGEGSGWLEWFPSTGLHSAGDQSMPFLTWLADTGWHLVLPVFCITYGGLAYLAKQMRAAMLDNFTMDYVRTARAKGVPSRHIVFRHVLRNSLLPIITIFATILPALIAGSIIIETIFGIEGMGLLVFRAVESRDYDVVQSMALIAGALNLTGLLIADICYAVADPRITYS